MKRPMVRTLMVRTLLVLTCTASTLACTLEEATAVAGEQLADCLDEAGCGQEPVDGFATWDAVLLINALYDDVEPQHQLTVTLWPDPQEGTCPEEPAQATATLNGLELTRIRSDDFSPCAGLSWILPEDKWPTEHATTSLVEVSDGETTFSLPTSFSLTQAPRWNLEGAVLTQGEWSRFQPLTAVSEAIETAVAIEVEEENRSRCDTAVDEGEFQVRPPEAAPLGIQELTLTAFASTEAPCAGGGFCSASIYSRQRFSAEILAP